MQKSMANLQSLRKFWANNSNSLTGLVVLALIVLLATTVWFQGSSPQPGSVDVLQADLSRTEQNQIRLTLARENLNEFGFENNRLMVPLSLQSKYLQVLLDAGTLPETLRGPDQELPAVNPFLSRSQQEFVQQNYRQQKLRSLLVQLPFIEDARVQLDVQQAASAFAAQNTSCVVSVWPKGKLILEHQQLATIHQNVLAAIAGIAAERIVINDLNSGSAWDYAQLKSFDPGNCSEQIDNLRLQRQTEHELQDSLAAWPGVGFAVDVSPGCANMLKQVSAVTILPPPAADTNPQIVSPGSNSRAKVPVILPSGSSNNAAIQATVFNGTERRFDSGLIRIWLTVDDQAIGNFLRRERDKSSGETWWGGESKPLPDSVAVRERIKQQLESQVRKQLAQSRHAASQEHEILVEFASALPGQAGLAGDRSNSWTSPNQGVLWALLPGLALCVLVVVSMSRRKGNSHPEPELSNTGKPDVWLDESAEAANRQQIREKIDELIENNPEAAARVIQSWIREAA